MPDELKRSSIAARRWAVDVKNRDGRMCVFCGSKEKIHAHHIYSWADNPELRTQPGNGLTVCLSCHSRIHEGRMGD